MGLASISIWSQPYRCKYSAITINQTTDWPWSVVLLICTDLQLRWQLSVCKCCLPLLHYTMKLVEGEEEGELPAAAAVHLVSAAGCHKSVAALPLIHNRAVTLSLPSMMAARLTLSVVKLPTKKVEGSDMPMCVSLTQMITAIKYSCSWEADSGDWSAMMAVRSLVRPTSQLTFGNLPNLITLLLAYSYTNVWQSPQWVCFWLNKSMNCLYQLLQIIIILFACKIESFSFGAVW